MGWLECSYSRSRFPDRTLLVLAGGSHINYRGAVPCRPRVCTLRAVLVLILHVCLHILALDSNLSANQFPPAYGAAGPPGRVLQQNRPGAALSWWARAGLSFQESCEPCDVTLAAWNRPWWEYSHHGDWPTLHIRHPPSPWPVVKGQRAGVFCPSQNRHFSLGRSLLASLPGGRAGVKLIAFVRRHWENHCCQTRATAVWLWFLRRWCVWGDFAF